MDDEAKVWFWAFIICLVIYWPLAIVILIIGIAKSVATTNTNNRKPK